jgi:hypothetical protein
MLAALLIDSSACGSCLTRFGGRILVSRDKSPLRLSLHFQLPTVFRAIDSFVLALFRIISVLRDAFYETPTPRLYAD